MKKLMTLGLVMALLLAAPAVVPSRNTANAQSAGLVSSILNRMERNRRDLRSLRAGITMQKYNAQIKQYERYDGEVQYVPGSGRNVSLRVDWTRPSRETLAVENGQYTLLKPRQNVAYKGSANSGKGSNKVSSVLGFGLNASGAQLRNNYIVEFVGEGILYGNLHVTQLKLTPKGSAGYQFAEVWVDDSGMPVQTRVVERNNDATTVRLTNVQKNARVDAAVFKLDIGGAKVVKG
jgi:outer membrane lipoprotein-sorting protein